MTAENSETIDSELLIGLVGAVGARLKSVIELLEGQLHLAGYETRVIKVSEEVIKSLVDVPEHHGSEYKRTSDLMTAGNRVREETSNNGVLALGVAAKIFAEREKDSNEYPLPLPKMAFIVDSLKRPEEVEVLRKVYPSGFVLVGAHEEERSRRKQLDQKGMSGDEASDLISRDGEEAKISHGQRLNRTFHLADFFLHITDSRDQLDADVRRMVQLWFGSPFITPTFDEYAMFMAFAAGCGRLIYRGKSAPSSPATGKSYRRAQTIAPRQAGGSTGRSATPRPKRSKTWAADATTCGGRIQIGRHSWKSSGRLRT